MLPPEYNCIIGFCPGRATGPGGTDAVMTLERGTKLGPYAIVEPLGAGGMGEVYRARDTKLGRDVALKILTGAFAADTDRLARFQREAQVLASLNHPNIAAIHGLEDSSGTYALIMELVEGPTLSKRIPPGPSRLRRHCRSPGRSPKPLSMRTRKASSIAT